METNWLLKPSSLYPPPPCGLTLFKHIQSHGIFLKIFFKWSQHSNPLFWREFITLALPPHCGDDRIASHISPAFPHPILYNKFRIFTFSGFYGNQRWTLLPFFISEIVLYLIYPVIFMHVKNTITVLKIYCILETHNEVHIALIFNNCFWLWPLTLTLVLVVARMPCTEVYSQSRLIVIFFSV